MKLTAIVTTLLLVACKSEPAKVETASGAASGTPPPPQCTVLVERMKACPDPTTAKLPDAEKAQFYANSLEGCVQAFAAGTAAPTAKGRDSQETAEVVAYAQAFTRRSAGCAAAADCAAFYACTTAPVE